MKYFLTSCFLLTIFLVNAQNNAFSNNEKLVFQASYNMSGILTELAQVTMETNQVKTSKSTFLHLKCKARTYSSWDNFFKINDIYESYVNTSSLVPYIHKRTINEGGYYKNMKYTFNYKTGNVKNVMRKRRGDGTFWEVNKSYAFNSNTKDIVSTIYAIRNIDYSSLSINKSLNFDILIDNKVEKITLNYLGNETISTNIGTKDCYKLAIVLNNKDILKGKNTNLLYLTADKNKIPVYAKFKVAIGNGELKIKSATGLKH